MEQPKYRIVAILCDTKTIAYSDTIEEARDLAKSIEGRIQTYVYGIGWTYYTEATESEND